MLHSPGPEYFYLMENSTTRTGAAVSAHFAEPAVHPDEQAFDRNFKPRGAIAFFILLIIFGLALWFSIYFIMLERV